MAKPVTKRFSNVRYWRYVFTPIIFLCLFLGISYLYMGTSSNLPKKPNYPTAPSANTGALSSVMGGIKKVLNSR